MQVEATRTALISFTIIVMLILLVQTGLLENTIIKPVELRTEPKPKRILYSNGTEVLSRVGYSRTTTSTSVRQFMNKSRQTLMYNENITSSLERGPQNRRMSRKLRIALYHVYHRILKHHIRSLNMSNCFQYQNCEVVYIKELTSGDINSDAVIFQGNNIPSKLPKHEDENQVFVFSSLESPVYLRFTNVGGKRFNNYFNWTMTYRLDSDIPYVYGSVIPKHAIKHKVLELMEINGKIANTDMENSLSGNKFNNFTQNVYKNYSEIYRQKTETALWFVSHCGTQSKRENYVREMAKYTNVTKIGKCNSKRVSVCPKYSNCDVALTKKYKFYIAFENSLCTDYITEKVFRWFEKDIIIIVRGARSYTKYLPKGTYIDTNSFKSPKALAKYLNWLGANEEEYNNILKLKDRYTIITEQEHAQIAYCNLCHKLNNLDQYRKSITNVNNWWGKNVCIHSKS